MRDTAGRAHLKEHSPPAFVSGRKASRAGAKMTINLKAHLESGQVALDEPLPESLRGKTIHVLIQDEADPAPRESELMQSASGFVREVLLDEGEDVWQTE